MSGALRVKFGVRAPIICLSMVLTWAVAFHLPSIKAVQPPTCAGRMPQQMQRKIGCLIGHWYYCTATNDEWW